MSYQRVALVLDRAIPQGWVRERLHAPTGHHRREGDAEAIGGDPAGPRHEFRAIDVGHGVGRIAPAALDEHDPAGAPEQAHPAAERDVRVRQCPDEMADEHHVERLVADRRVGGVPHQHRRRNRRLGQLGAGQLDHPRREVDTDHSVAGLGGQQRQRTGPAAEVEHVTRWRRQPVPQQARPGSANRGVALRRQRQLVAQTVYQCPACEERYLGERRCSTCNLMCRKLGLGGRCSGCDELLTVGDLIGFELDGGDAVA